MRHIMRAWGRTRPHLKSRGSLIELALYAVVSALVLRSVVSPGEAWAEVVVAASSLALAIVLVPTMLFLLYLAQSIIILEPIEQLREEIRSGTLTAQQSAPVRRITPLTKVTSEGILWQGNENGAEAYCPEHEVPLLFRVNASGRVKSPERYDPITTKRDPSGYGGSWPGQLFCSEGDGHTMLLAQSATYGEAQKRAQVLVRAEIRRSIR